MKNKRIKTICLAETLGYLNEPIERKFWIHPMNKLLKMVR